MGNEVVVKSAMDSMAGRLQVSRPVLEQTLKATVCRGTSNKDGSYTPMTNSEFVAFVVVSNNYKLNPLIKEIYAYPDTKSAGIIPIVSTDGWNKLMTTHPKYKTHSYIQSEKMVKIGNSKNCPEWMEIHIVKTDGSVVKIREYLDECYNGGKKYKSGDYIKSPWDTHTKRLLRHKTKIQGVREAFGFGGIYDQDEGDRIIEAHIVREETAGKPEVEQPKALSDENPLDHSKIQKLEEPEPENTTEPEKKDKPAKKTSGAPEIVKEEAMTEKKTKKEKEVEKKQEVGNDGYFDLLAKARKLKKEVGEDVYYKTLGAAGFEKSNQMKASDLKQFIGVLEDMKSGLKKETKGKDTDLLFQEEEREPGQEG